MTTTLVSEEKKTKREQNFNKSISDLFPVNSEVERKAEKKGATIRGTWMAIIHLGALSGIWFFSWNALFTCIGLFWLTGGLGICLGFHRLLTHRSFQAPKWVEYTLAFFGMLAVQGSSIFWVASHRAHHLYSDQEGDPHSPRKGFWWSHMFWLFDKNLLSTKDLNEKFAADLLKDPVHRFLNNFQFVPILLSAGILLAFGVEYFVWGFLVRTVLVYHSTWFVNSATHLWGYKNFDSNDDSRNLWWVALVSFGEGWHNNHHAFQSSARHGMKWWEFDITYLTIRFLGLLGLAKNIQVPRTDSVSK